MLLQSLCFIIPLLFLMATSCTSTKHVEFLGFGGCPNTPELRKRLVEAEPNVIIIDVDLMSMPKGDPRLGWGAPTILIEGKDLFNVPANENGDVSCRNWSDGLPSVEEIRIAIKETN
ncbi:MAG: hypothetical protein ACKVIO_06575 [Phycisphaerales bacterium]|jgi:hypothetical protein